MGEPNSAFLVAFSEMTLRVCALRSSSLGRIRFFLLIEQSCRLLLPESHFNGIGGFQGEGVGACALVPSREKMSSISYELTKNCLPDARISHLRVFKFNMGGAPHTLSHGLRLQYRLHRRSRYRVMPLIIPPLLGKF